MVGILICGGGSGTHVLAGLASSVPGTQVHVLALKGDKAERWNEAALNGTYTVNINSPGSGLVRRLHTKPHLVSNQPGTAISGCDVIVFCVPAYAHAEYLEVLRPYAKPGTIIAGLPGQAGFEFEVRHIWGELAGMCTLISYDTLPWVSRLISFGTEASIFGTKNEIKGSVERGSVQPSQEAQELLQNILGSSPKLLIEGHLVGTTFNALNGYLHPVIMYGQWHDWDGKPCSKKPGFYTGVTDATAQLLDRVSCEILATAAGIMEQMPEVDLNNADHLYDIIVRYYDQGIKDKTNLKTVITTNGVYQGLEHPVIETVNGKYLPDFSHRYLSEDIPYGLAVIRGIAEVANVSTPHIDTVLHWAQGKMNKDYLVDGKMSGKDIQESRCPQRYGLNTLGALLNLEP